MLPGLEDHKQSPFLPNRHAKHKNWYSTPFSDIEDVERMISASSPTHDTGSDLEGADFGTRRISSPEFLDPMIICPVSDVGIGIYDETNDMYDLMPSIAQWNRENQSGYETYELDLYSCQ